MNEIDTSQLITYLRFLKDRRAEARGNWKQCALIDRHIAETVEMLSRAGLAEPKILWVTPESVKEARAAIPKPEPPLIFDEVEQPFDAERFRAIQDAIQRNAHTIVSNRMQKEEAWLASLFPDGLPAEGEYSRVCFQENPAIVALVPTAVIDAVERGERTLTLEEAKREFPYMETETEWGPSPLAAVYPFWRAQQDAMKNQI